LEIVKEAAQLQVKIDTISRDFVELLSSKQRGLSAAPSTQPQPMEALRDGARKLVRQHRFQRKVFCDEVPKRQERRLKDCSEVKRVSSSPEEDLDKENVSPTSAIANFSRLTCDSTMSKLTGQENSIELCSDNLAANRVKSYDICDFRPSISGANSMDCGCDDIHTNDKNEAENNCCVARIKSNISRQWSMCANNRTSSTNTPKNFVKDSQDFAIPVSMDTQDDVIHAKRSAKNARARYSYSKVRTSSPRCSACPNDCFASKDTLVCFRKDCNCNRVDAVADFRVPEKINEIVHDVSTISEESTFEQHERVKGSTIPGVEDMWCSTFSFPLHSTERKFGGDLTNIDFDSSDFTLESTDHRTNPVKPVRVTRGTTQRLTKEMLRNYQHWLNSSANRTKTDILSPNKLPQIRKRQVCNRNGAVNHAINKVCDSSDNRVISRNMLKRGGGDTVTKTCFDAAYDQLVSSAECKVSNILEHFEGDKFVTTKVRKLTRHNGHTKLNSLAPEMRINTKSSLVRAPHCVEESLTQLSSDYETECSASSIDGSYHIDEPFKVFDSNLVDDSADASRSTLFASPRRPGPGPDPRDPLRRSPSPNMSCTMVSIDVDLPGSPFFSNDNSFARNANSVGPVNSTTVYGTASLGSCRITGLNQFTVTGSDEMECNISTKTSAGLKHELSDIERDPRSTVEPKRRASVLNYMSTISEVSHGSTLKRRKWQMEPLAESSRISLGLCRKCINIPKVGTVSVRSAGTVSVSSACTEGVSRASTEDQTQHRKHASACSLQPLRRKVIAKKIKRFRRAMRGTSAGGDADMKLITFGQL